MQDLKQNTGKKKHNIKIIGWQFVTQDYSLNRENLDSYITCYIYALFTFKTCLKHVDVERDHFLEQNNLHR